MRGINLIAALWSDGDRFYPCDYLVYHNEGDGKIENGHSADFGWTDVTWVKGVRKE